jgi:phospho-N-acetylmuramoyl-pentapeptide-transferase
LIVKESFLITAALTLATGAAVSLLMGPILIPALRRLKFGQWVRDDGPQRHLVKSGTPTMGGVMFLTGILVASLLWIPWERELFVVLAITWGYGIIGFIDDFIKVAMRRPLGLRAREKLTGQIILGLLLGIAAIWGLDRGTEVLVPFYGGSVDLGYGYLLFALAVVVGTGNAVNFTDGLDGLATGTVIIAAGAYAVISLMLDRTGLALYALAIVGGCLGFLYFNRYPARVFMGDTGSLALGGALASLAVLTRTELLLFIIGGVFAMEVISVIIQVISFQTTGRRVFLMSPLHHHFELLGWSEVKVVRVFWMAALVLAVLGLVPYF